MKNYAWLLLVFIFLNAGCRDETEIIPTNTEDNTVTDLQNVTTIDGAVMPVSCETVTLNSGEIYQICKPSNWNGDLIIYAHGYVSAFAPLALPTEAAAYVPLFTSLGYAFATTSYSENGLAIQSGIDNIVDLRKRFVKAYGEPEHVYLTGGSEGGIVTTLAIERYPKLFSAGLSLCGPYGDFQRQINYYADFRVIFDHYFPGVLPGDAINIPDELIQNWTTRYVPAILGAIAARPDLALKVLQVTGAAYVPGNNNTIAETFIRVLWYDVFATRDAIKKLKGQPYDNSTRVYVLPGNPTESALINAQVPRYTADKHAQKNIQKYYETTGNITIPLVSAHTTLDPVIPFWHLPLYNAKVVAAGTSALFTGLPVSRYGHCNFTEAEIALGFATLVYKVTGQPLILAQTLISRSRQTNGKIVQSVRVARK